MRRVPLLLFALSIFSALSAQVQKPGSLKAYESCAFPDGLTLADVQAMPSDVHDRPVQTHGKPGTVPLLAGRRVTFAYPGQEPYASVKVEQLPEANYPVNRKLLLDDFDDIVASDKTVARNLKRTPRQSGFDIVGLDRMQLRGTTLGIYLLLDTQSHVAATVYLLNPKGKFKTLAEYASARETFLYNYTRCVRNNQNGTIFGVAR